MVPVEYDAVIVGAGLSGLTLASRLSEGPHARRRILVVDDAQHDVRGRVWAFWTQRPDGLASAASATWDAIAVHASGTSRVLPIRPYRYVAVSGERLHDGIRARPAVAAHVEFVTGVVDNVRDDGEHAVVTLDGTAVTAAWVFDSRPPTPVPGGPRLAFLGWEIETDAEAFDPSVATFMDFRGRDAGTVSFCYVLPTTARHALVEIAAFRWGDEAPDLCPALTDYLRRVRRLSSWKVARTEAGCLGLTRPTADVRGGHVVSIGVRGGLLKPSTGFAAERIQRHNAAIAGSLRRYGHPHAVGARHRRHAWLDRVFLDALRRDPDIVEDVMDRLFARNRASAVLRFLDEDSDALQEARLVATLPVAPFLRAALRSRGGSQLGR